MAEVSPKAAHKKLGIKGMDVKEFEKVMKLPEKKKEAALKDLAKQDENFKNYEDLKKKMQKAGVQ